MHLDILCHSESIITTLSSIPSLEELILAVTGANALALGRKFFTALMASTSESSDRAGWSASLCSNLQSLGLRYRRWIRGSETDNVTSLLPHIVALHKRTMGWGGLTDTSIKGLGNEMKGVEWVSGWSRSAPIVYYSM